MSGDLSNLTLTTANTAQQACITACNLAYMQVTGGTMDYGTGDGFGGWNCRHDWFPFFEGISERAYTDKRLKELNAR